jgi:hypothetical protein
MRWKSYISLILTILLLRFLDLYITFHYTPDLGNEWNPLVTRFNLSWPGFILVQLLIVIFVSFLMFFYFSKKPAVITLKNLPFHDLIYVYFFDKLKKWPDRIFRFPIHFRRHFVFMGFVFMFVTIFISLFAIIHNLLLINQITSYVRFVSKYHPLYFPLLFTGITIISVYTFFTIEYVNYKRAGLK